MQGTRGAIRSGGDQGAELQASPPSGPPLAFYSGIVTVGADGAAEIAFDIPDFAGTLRVMAVAWSKDKVGHTSADVTVRDPVVLSATLPRFLLPGDRSSLHLDLDNVEGEGGDYALAITSTGALAGAATQKLTLRAKERGALIIPIAANAAGNGTVRVAVTGPAGFALNRSFALTVRPPGQILARRTVKSLGKGESLTVSSDLFADLVPGTGAVSVSVGVAAAFDAASLLAALDRYPYRCSEQVTSRALPLLYLSDLAGAAHVALDPQTDQHIRDSIEALLTRQDSNGSFGLWSVGGNDVWLDSYVTDFLSRARERKYAVPDEAFKLALNRLRNAVAAIDRRRQEWRRRYRLCALCARPQRVGADRRSALSRRRQARRAVDPDRQGADCRGARHGRRPRPGRARLRRRARFDRAAAAARYVRPGGLWLDLARCRRPGRARGRRRRAARDGAGGGATGQCRLRVSRYLSTQEEAWLLLAARALAKDGGGLSLDVNGEARQRPFSRTIRAADLTTPVRVTNNSDAAVDGVVTVTGAPLTPEPAAEKGFKIERETFTLAGDAVDAKTVKQNTRLAVVLKITEAQPQFGRVIVADYLPAGFEIDNPHIVSSGDTGTLSWITDAVEPVSSEFRDDRFTAAFERKKGDPAVFTVAYVVRAVAPGKYLRPQASVEDMYRPDRFGRTATESVEVTAK